MKPRPGSRAAALDELARLMKSAAHQLDRALAEELGGVSTPAWHVLTALDGDVGKSMAELGAVTLLPGASLTRLVDGMVDDNLVLRRADVSDRRRVLVCQTPRGAAVAHGLCHRLAHSERVGAVLADNMVLAVRIPALLTALQSPNPSPALGDI